ncbi:transcriptional regulator [Acinetobacter cumulans]|uniref:transcriptional regulator n=1 Tax=Acinetobacter cumulans TaxID=2136182 RepID=UPI000D12C49E|nr:transcriptional regulator [Acinetobacter cumulans]QCO20030.1 transcriptional regulator [Acinetobacter cumulans]
MTIRPIRVQFKTACQILDISRESLRHIVRTDESFARPIKMGESKQSPIFFDYAELMQWHEAQKMKVMEQEVLG